MKSGARSWLQERLSTVAVVLSLGAAFGVAASADARTAIDCPLRDQAYSVDSPFMDLMLKPEARTAIEHEAPNLLQRLPPMLSSTEPPAFSAITTMRYLAAMGAANPESLERIDRVLASLPVTDADREARCARYDTGRPRLTITKGKLRLLLFEKMTGFRDGPSVEAANAALRAMAQRNGWAIAVTDKGGAMTPSILRKFDAVIWNNVSGDVLTLSQRRAFEDYIAEGGGYVGIHGSGGDPVYYWDWYADTLIGARFAGHPMDPQFQDARALIESSPSAIGRELAPGWTMNDEWYSFRNNPRNSGSAVIATLDESSYSPVGRGGQDLRMGDHPIAWTRCIGDGRSFYSAIGHRPEIYSDQGHVKLLEQGIAWAAGMGRTQCRAGREVYSRG
jgi:hypothetical protein